MRKPKIELTDEIKALDKRQDSGVITQVRRYDVITPIYGGGVEPAENDFITPIRGTEVRGHLRFWWRASRGGRFGGNLKALKKMEDRIWGSASVDKPKKDKNKRPAAVRIQILEANQGTKLGVFEVARNPNDPRKTVVTELNKANVPAYAAFPLRPDKDAAVGTKSPAVYKDAAFTMRISYAADHREDVEAALWAWETFGGIGARTRRGFGALRCLQVDGADPPALPPGCGSRDVENWIVSQLKQEDVEEEWPDHVSHLAAGMRLRAIKVPGDPIDAWKWLIGAFQQFRQSREGGPYGPSHWPEPNAVRQAVKGTVSSKSPALGNKTPRAYFGLPIIFHFPQEGDVPDVTLKGKETDRMASPLILRSLYCDDRNAIALAAALEGPQIPIEGLVLDEDKGPNHPADPDLKAPEAAQIEPLNGEVDVIKAFLDSL